MFQERLLSSRILHFGREQLYWECNELSACESQPNGFIHLHKFGPLPPPVKTSLKFVCFLSGLTHGESGRIGSVSIKIGPLELRRILAASLRYQGIRWSLYRR